MKRAIFLPWPRGTILAPIRDARWVKMMLEAGKTSRRAENVSTENLGNAQMLCEIAAGRTCSTLPENLYVEATIENEYTSVGDGMHLADLICGVNRKIEQELEAKLKVHGISIVQFRVLKTLAAENGLPMGDLALRVFVDSPTLTKIIDKMVTSADVYRGPDPRDRRRVLIFLSRKGRTTFDRLQSIDADIEAALNSSVGEEQRVAFVNAMLVLTADPRERKFGDVSKPSSLPASAVK